ncbi:MAG: substrate-binding domain-containing protein, partial [Oscillospiraceae bacterium]|nr:substrate-binding domain-containing protein [Oscillospiraceae bacterium]
ARIHYKGTPLSYMFYSELREPIIDLCAERNIDVVIATVSNLGWEYRVPNTLMFEDVDGVIVLGDIPQMYLDKFRSMHLPLLELDPSYTYPDQKAIRIDFRHAVCSATQHLLDLGHRDIAYFGGGKQRDQNLQAFAGFQETMSAISQPLDLRRIQMDLAEDMVKSAVDVQLDSNPRPTAIICTADCLAIAAMQRLQERRVRVPEDISLVTINDITTAQFVSPALSAVHVDTHAIAKLAFDTLMRQINHEKVETIVYTPSELIRRGSSAPAK